MSLKRTDGAWDPSGPFRYFCSIPFRAGSPRTCFRVSDSHLFTPDRISGGAALEMIIDAVRSRASTMLVDSGVFGIASAASKATGRPLPECFATPYRQLDGWQGHWKRWTKVIDLLREDCWGYVEIDLGGVEGKRETREWVEEQGYRPIPVFHALADPWDYFEELAGTYDRIAIGNLVQASEALRFRILRRIRESRKGMPVRWIHALGVYPYAAFLACPTESCDASSPSAPLQFGLPMLDSSAMALRHLDSFGYRHGEGKHAYQTMVAWNFRDALFAERNGQMIMEAQA